MNLNIIKQSFKNVKKDFDILRVSFSDWIHFLKNNQINLQKRVEVLETRIKELEENQKILVY